jgi:type II secretory ATPase GspE/PulE/Tfp pilus assembly ATPase PilB-like protein
LSAQIVDIRESDKTIKVCYQDGGFKRFPIDEFSKLVTTTSASSESNAFGYYDYELDADQMGRFDDMWSNEKDQYKKELAIAVQSKDFNKAAKLKRAFDEKVARRSQLIQLDAQLKLAIQLEDFEKAEKLHKELEDAKAKAKNVTNSNDKDKKADGSNANMTFTEIIQKAASRAASGGLAGGMEIFNFQFCDVF